MNTNEIKGIKKDKNTKLRNPFGNVLDDLKLKSIKHTIQSKDEYAAKDMALKLSDDKKIQVISLFESDVCKLELALSLNDDNNKIAVLDLIDDKEAVISSLSSDTVRLQALKDNPLLMAQFVAPTLEIFAEFDNYDGKIDILEAIIKNKKEINIDEVIKELKGQMEYYHAVKSISDDAGKVQAMSKLSSDYLKSEIIKTFEDEDKKIKAITLLKSDVGIENVINTLSSDDKKIELLDLCDTDESRWRIINSLQDDDKKVELLSKIGDNEVYLSSVISGFKDDEMKIKCMSLVNEDTFKEDIALSLEDENKIKVLNLFESMDSIELIVLSIEDSELQLSTAIKALDYEHMKEYETEDISKNEKFKDLKRLLRQTEKVQKSKDESEKMSFINSTDNDYLKCYIASTINNDDIKRKVIKSISIEKLKFNLIDTLTDESKRLEEIRQLPSNSIRNYRQMGGNLNFIKNNMSSFIEMEGFQGKISEEIINELFEKNNLVVRNIDFRILEPKYIQQLGKDRINLLTCYSDIQEKFLSLGEKESYLFSRCIKNFTERANTDEWTVLANELLENLSNGEFSELINNLNNVEELSESDFYKLTQVLQNSNWCDISQLNEVRNYEAIIQSKVTNVMTNENASIQEKRNALTQKIFGHDFIYAKNIIERFGEDIENLPEGDMKDYVRCLQLIEKCDDKTVLNKIFENCEFVQTDKVTIERNLKNEFGKMLNDGLYSPNEQNLLPETSNVYEAGVDFNMIITSVGAFIENNPENYKEDWNRPVIATQHFCASYIRNDMIGTAPISNICYGFTGMKEDSLMLSSNRDMYSSSGQFKSNAFRKEKYYTPEGLINNTERYNEICFRRIQNGEKKQPDYIVVFRRNGVIPNMDEAQKASKQWGNMPIVVVDVDKCLLAEKQKVNNLLQEYEKNPTPQLAKQIKQKVRNNKVTDINFDIDIKSELEKVEISDLEQENNIKTLKENKVKLQDMEENYKQVNAIDKKRELGKIQKMYKKMIELARGDNNVQQK